MCRLFLTLTRVYCTATHAALSYIDVLCNAGTEALDPATGRIYYYNKTSRETTWYDPTRPNPRPNPRPLTALSANGTWDDIAMHVPRPMLYLHANQLITRFPLPPFPHFPLLAPLRLPSSLATINRTSPEKRAERRRAKASPGSPTPKSGAAALFEKSLWRVFSLYCLQSDVHDISQMHTRQFVNFVHACEIPPEKAISSAQITLFFAKSAKGHHTPKSKTAEIYDEYSVLQNAGQKGQTKGRKLTFEQFLNALLLVARSV